MTRRQEAPRTPFRWPVCSPLHLWAGIDAGKAHHHCVVVDAEGTRLLSRKIPNDEPALLELIADVLGLADEGNLVWATDPNHGGTALLIALLLARGHNLLYIPGRTVHHASRIFAVTAKRTPKTLLSSLTRPGCATTCSPCAQAMKPAPG